MCKKFFYLFWLVLLAVSIPTNIVNAAAPPGIIAWWSLNEGSGTNAPDISGNSNDATLNGEAAWTTGKYGGGVHIGGLNDYIEIPDLINDH